MPTRYTSMRVRAKRRSSGTPATRANALTSALKRRGPMGYHAIIRVPRLPATICRSCHCAIARRPRLLPSESLDLCSRTVCIPLFAAPRAGGRCWKRCQKPVLRRPYSRTLCDICQVLCATPATRRALPLPQQLRRPVGGDVGGSTTPVVATVVVVLGIAASCPIVAPWRDTAAPAASVPTFCADYYRLSRKR